MLFWGLGILNMTLLLFTGGAVAAVVGGCYTAIIYAAARIITENGYMSSDE